MADSPTAFSLQFWNQNKEPEIQVTMNIAETIYQHVKTMPMAKAIEVLHFVEFLQTKPDAIANTAGDNEALEFMQSLPIISNRTDTGINNDFQALRDEWEHP